MTSQKSKTGFFKQTVDFVAEVRKEVSKVTWASRKETTITTTFVFVFCVIAGIYLCMVDFVSYRFIDFILKLGV